MKVFVVYTEREIGDSDRTKNQILHEDTNVYEWIAKHNSLFSKRKKIYSLIAFWNIADFDVRNISEINTNGYLNTKIVSLKEKKEKQKVELSDEFMETLRKSQEDKKAGRVRPYEEIAKECGLRTKKEKQT